MSTSKTCARCDAPRVSGGYCREHAAEYRRERRKWNREIERCACGRVPVEGAPRCERCQTQMNAQAERRRKQAAGERKAKQRDKERAQKERRQLAKRLGAAMRAARLRGDLDQAEVAERAGVTQQTYARYEGGQVLPPVSRIAVLAQVLGTTPGALKGGKPPTPRALAKAVRARAGRAARAQRGEIRWSTEELEALKGIAPDLGAKLRDARMTAGLTQSEVASRAGVSQALYSRYENGALFPPYPVLAQIVDVLGIPRAGVGLEAARKKAKGC